MKKVIIGGPVRARGWVLPRWFEAVRALEVPEGVLVETAFLLSPSEDDTKDIVTWNADYVIFDSEAGRTVEEIEGHFWGGSSYDYMARIRNDWLDFAWAQGADYVFSLDSDILLPPTALVSLLERIGERPGVVSPALNLGQHGLAWNVMAWSNPDVPGQAYRPDGVEPAEGYADIVCAALLMDQTASAVRFAAHPQGEDIGFCIDAHRKGVARWWAKEVLCDHLMRRC